MAEYSRVLAYIAKAFAGAQKVICMRRHDAEAHGKYRYVFRPMASTTAAPGAATQWLGLVCDYDVKLRALKVVDRECAKVSPLRSFERVFSGEIALESRPFRVSYCDSEAVAFLQGLPVASEGLAVPTAGWREYLKWRQKLAETKASEAYSYTECERRGNEIVRFHLRDLAVVEKLRQRFLNEELCVSKAPAKSVIQGEFRRISVVGAKGRHAGTGPQKVAIDLEFSALDLEDPSRIPPEGELRISMEGELAMLDVQLNGLRRFSEHQGANPHLAEWLFDIGRAKALAESSARDWKPDTPLNPEQSSCVGKALALDDLLLMWGPPGTGKTTVIAEICSQYARLGKRVLVSSQANLAVDQALARLPALPHLRPVWVSSARRREGNAGSNSGFMHDWLMAVRHSAQQGVKASESEPVWKDFLEEWVDCLDHLQPEDCSADDELFYLKKANVIGATCNETGKPEFIASPRFSSLFDLVIVDEVSKATPPEMLLPMLMGRRTLLVGDHRQLPPMFRDEAFEEAVENNEISQGEVEQFRDMVTAAWFDHYYRNAPTSVRCGLRRQYRMHPQIMEAVNLFYADQLLQAGDGAVELARQKEHGLVLRGANGRTWLHPSQHLVWIDTSRDAQGREARDERIGTSRLNETEAELCAQIVSDLTRNPRARDLSVAVISFYKAQIGLLRDYLRRERLPEEQFHVNRDINTVDQFQGSERDIVIVSLVRTDPRLTGEFARDFRRINVAFSRAKKLLIILASQPTFCGAAVAVPAEDSKLQTKAVYRVVQELARRTGASIEPSAILATSQARSKESHV